MYLISLEINMLPFCKYFSDRNNENNIAENFESFKIFEQIKSVKVASF